MSIFTPGNSNPDPEAPTPPEGSTYLDQLVGPGKKFATVEDLAKGKWESDAVFIPRLEQEAQNARQELQTKLQMEELIAEIKAAQAAASRVETPSTPNGQAPQGAQSATVSLDQVNALMEQKLTETQKLLAAQKNVDFAEAELIKQWGNSTKAKVDAKAKELGVSHDFLKSMAAHQPKAFLEMMGANKPTQQVSNDFVPPRSELSPTTKLPAGERTQSYYNKMKKENPKLYWSQEVQVQEHNDSMRLRERFFD